MGRRSSVTRRRRIRRKGIVGIVLLAMMVAAIFLNVRKNQFRLDGIAAYGQGQYAEALQQFAKGEETWAPCSFAIKEDMQWYTASCYLMQGDYVQAQTVYRAMLEKNKKSERLTLAANIAAALASYGQGDYTAAAAAITPLAGEACPGLYLYLGSCYMELGQYADMEAAFLNYRQMGYDSDYLHAELAVYAMQAGDYERAMTEISAGLTLGGGYQRQLLWLEICCLEYQRNFQAAYEKMQVYAGTYALTEEEQKEWNFLQTRDTTDVSAS